MKVTLENTNRIVEIEVAGVHVPARVWEGTTERGVKCYALITRIAVHQDDNTEEFNRDLQEQKPPSPRALEVFDRRLVL